MSPELIAAVKERLDIGYSDDKIREELKNAGYDDATVEEAFKQAMAETGQPSSVVPKPPSASGEVLSQPVSGSGLPGAMSLFKGGFQFVFDRLDLLGYLLIPYIIGVIFQAVFVGSMFGDSLPPNFFATMAVVFVVSLVLGILNFINAGAVLYTVTKKQVQRVGYGEAFRWSRSHFWSLLWIQILTVLAVYGGTILFFIPGIIVAVHIFFSQFVLANEETKGMKALLHSRALVKGRGWDVFFTLFVVAVLFLLVLIPVFIVLSLFMPNPSIAGSFSAYFLINGLINVVISAFAVMMFIHIGGEMYRALTAARSSMSTSQKEEGRTKYTVLAWIGLLLPALLVVSSIILMSLSGARDQGMAALMNIKMAEASVAAEAYYEQGGLNSYAGVCGEIESKVSDADSVSCRDSVAGWALSTEFAGVSYCVDNNSYPTVGYLPSDSVECSFQRESNIDSEDFYSNDPKARAAELRELSQ